MLLGVGSGCCLLSPLLLLQVLLFSLVCFDIRTFITLFIDNLILLFLLLSLVLLLLLLLLMLLLLLQLLLLMLMLRGCTF